MGVVFTLNFFSLLVVLPLLVKVKPSVSVSFGSYACFGFASGGGDFGRSGGLLSVRDLSGRL